MIILVSIAVLTFSSLVFFAEKDSPALQWTFLDSFWWGLMTLTTGEVRSQEHCPWGIGRDQTHLFTVGYGTQSPASLTGKAIGGICAIVGVFILTLPVPIVVNSFASYYKNRLWRNEVAHKRRLRAQEQTRLVKEILTGSRRPSHCDEHDHRDGGGGGLGGLGDGDARRVRYCTNVIGSFCPPSKSKV